MAEIEPNASEIAARDEIMCELVSEGAIAPETARRYDGIVARVIARHTRPRWTDERPTTADVGCVASLEPNRGETLHGVVVQDEEEVLWLRTAVGSLWIHDPHLRGRWCVYPKPMDVN